MKTRPIYLSFLLGIVLYLLVPLKSLQASCGINHCTLVRPSASQSVGQVVNVFRFTEDIHEQTYYLENFLGVGWNAFPHLNLMFLAPVVYVEHESFGLGNSVFQVDYQWNHTRWGWAGGMQFELPTASQALYGDQHSLVLPYVRGWWHKKRWSAQVQLGIAQTLDFGHHSHGNEEGHHDEHKDDKHKSDDHEQGMPHMTHAHSNTHSGDFIINPHASSEMLWRIQAQWATINHTQLANLMLGMDGVQELVAQQNTVLNALVGIQSQISRIRMQMIFLYPLTSAKRFEHRLLFSVSIPFGDSGSSHTSQAPNPSFGRTN